MIDLSYKRICLPVLLVIFTVSTPVKAQDPMDVASDNVSEKAGAEEIEASSNLRDSIHENLETMQEDAKSVEDLIPAETETPPV